MPLNSSQLSDSSATCNGNYRSVLKTTSLGQVWGLGRFSVALQHMSCFTQDPWPTTSATDIPSLAGSDSACCFAVSSLREPRVGKNGRTNIKEQHGVNPVCISNHPSIYGIIPSLQRRLRRLVSSCTLCLRIVRKRKLLEVELWSHSACSSFLASLA